MPPKKAGKKGAKKDESKGGGKKSKNKVKLDEGPVPWKLTKERLAQLSSLRQPLIKEQVCNQYFVFGWKLPRRFDLYLFHSAD